ncbi:MAG: hypothetical protein P4L46_17605 [Fimbriimonas sp.]|nr:hypothetical protein [Fimbriimonas sp.]
MKFRSFIALAGWAMLAAAIAQNEQAHPSAHPQATPPTPESRTLLIHSGYQRALEDIEDYDSRDVKVRNSQGKMVTIKFPKTFPKLGAQTYKILHNNVLRDTHVAMFAGTAQYSLEFWAVSQFGHPLQAGSLQLDKDTGISIGSLRPDQEKQVVAFAEKALPTVTQTNGFKGQLFGSDAQVLPLKVTRQECLSCHSRSKEGDVLALMVYRIKRNTK